MVDSQFRRDVVSEKPVTRVVPSEIEGLFRVFFENAPIAKAVTRADGSWLYVNAALVAMLGYSEEELRATSFLEVTHPDDLAATREVLGRLLGKECTSQSFEKRSAPRTAGTSGAT